MPRENEEGRPRVRAASRKDDIATVARPPDVARRIRSLRPVDRRRLLERLAELELLGHIARQPGTLAST
jgi:hypothetical protein